MPSLMMGGLHLKSCLHAFHCSPRHLQIAYNLFRIPHARARSFAAVNAEIAAEDQLIIDGAGLNGRSPEESIKMGSTLRLTCNNISGTGTGVCKTAGGFVVFVPLAIPGETVDVRITKASKSSAEGVKLATVHPSPMAAEPQCRHFETCGGCCHQNIEYSGQLKQKHKQVVETLTRIGKLSGVDKIMLPPVPSQQEYGYRNKMTFAVDSEDEWLQNKETRKTLAASRTVGLYGRGPGRQIEEIQDCKLQDPEANEILDFTRSAIPSIQKKARGIVKRIVIRKGVGKGDQPSFLVLFHTKTNITPVPVTEAQIQAQYEEFSAEIRKKFPHVTDIAEAREILTREKAYPLLTRILGVGWQMFNVNGILFRVPTLSFFQTNTQQAGELLRMVYEGAGLRKGDTVTDLYCGVGLLGIGCAVMAAQAGKPLKRLQATDIYNQSSQMAKKNLDLAAKQFPELKDIGRRRIKSSDLEQPTLGQSVRTNVVIVDPARDGLSRPVIHYLLRCEARTVVYVSCDVATMARDIAELCKPQRKEAYRLQSAQVLDMFPQTSHVECVAVLHRNKLFDPNASEKNTYVPKQKGSRFTAAERLLEAEEL